MRRKASRWREGVTALAELQKPGGQKKMFLNSLHRTSARLRICLALAGAVSSVVMVGEARAQGAYPTKPIRIVVGFAAGGPSDILARVAGAAMSKTLGEQV
jgi:hypothetical protein